MPANNIVRKTWWSGLVGEYATWPTFFDGALGERAGGSCAVREHRWTSSGGNDRWAVAQAYLVAERWTSTGARALPTATATPAAATSPTASSPARRQASPAAVLHQGQHPRKLVRLGGGTWQFSGVNGAPGELPEPAGDDHAGHHPGRPRHPVPLRRQQWQLPGLRAEPADQRVYPSWSRAQGNTPGTSVPMSQFFVATLSNTAADRLGPGRGLQPALHPRRLQRQPDHQCQQLPEHGRARPRLPDPHPDRRRGHHARR